jgi:hypothetical protein
MYTQKCKWKNNHGDCDLYSKSGKDDILKVLNCNQAGVCKGDCPVKE